jgi:hypothetical protein
MNIVSKRLELVEISKTDLKVIHQMFSIPEAKTLVLMMKVIKGYTFEINSDK